MVEKKGVPKIFLISCEMKTGKLSESRLKSNDKKHNMKSITLVVMYHPLLKSFSAIVDKNISILYVDKDGKRVSTPPAMVSFLSARKLNGYLVTAKIYPLERTVGSYFCRSKQYRECNKITDTDSFICSNDQTNFKINYKFDCNEQSLIHLITCNRCLKQFVRPAADEFRHRWKNYKDNTRKFEKGEYCMQRHLYEHFNLSCHSGFLGDVSVTLIDKTYSKNSTERKDYWIYTFKPKHHWHLMLIVVFSHKLLYFAAMIIFIDGLYLNDNFRAFSLSFHCFHCCCCWLRYFIIIVVLFLYYTWSYTL